MQIIPDELTIYSKQRYYDDLTYRTEVDLENISERRLRLALLFNSDLTYELDY